MRKSDTVKPLGGKKINLKIRIIIILSFYVVSNNFASTINAELSSGIDLFLNNKPAEAASLFAIALKKDPGSNKIYNYLGIVYEQLGENGKAIETYKRGLEVAGDLKSTFLTNIANNLSIMGNYEDAIDYYTQAINIDNNGDALRNRAGEYLRKQFYSEALSDYKLYIAIETNPYQEAEIKRVISLLELKMDELARKQIEDERKRLEEEARQKELLSQVLNSLNSAGDDTTNLSAGTESVEDYNTDFDIVD